MKVSIVTISAPDRAPFLRRLEKQCRAWIHQYEWIMCGAAELASVAKEVGITRHIPIETVHGTARNLAAEAATGDILIQLDDDDWQNPERVQRQVAALTGPMPGKENYHPELVGSSWLYCLVSSKKMATRSSYWDTAYLLAGATMAYYRSAWKVCPFPDERCEDGPFSGAFQKRGTLLDMRDPDLIIYMRDHGREAHHVLDWWQETRHRVHARSALEIVRDRLQNPHQRLRFVQTAPDRELAMAHEEKASTVYVKYLMGDDFEEFCKPLEGT
jgi:glycosyltransferase involved in cell wall biosynthesis